MVFPQETNYAKITAYYSVALERFSMDPHQHPACEIIFVTKGKCKIKIENQVIVLERNDFVFINAFVEHALLVEGDSCTLLNIEFLLSETPSGLCVRDVFAYIKGNVQLNEPYAKSRDVRQFGQAIKSLLQLLMIDDTQEQPSAERQFTIELLFKRMLMELAFSLRTKETKRGNCYVNAAVNYIQQHFDEDIQVSQIAAAVGITKAYLHKLFHEQLGVTVNHFLTSERLKQAAFLLSNSQLPIVEIAAQAGFNSRQHFTNTFKQKKGMSPKAYQLLYKQTIKEEAGQHITGDDPAFLLMK